MNGVPCQPEDLHTGRFQGTAWLPDGSCALRLSVDGKHKGARPRMSRLTYAGPWYPAAFLVDTSEQPCVWYYMWCLAIVIGRSHYWIVHPDRVRLSNYFLN